MTATMTHETMHPFWLAGYKAVCQGETLAELVEKVANDPRKLRLSVEQWQAILDGFNRVGADE
jgi:hypothetical protein